MWFSLQLPNVMDLLYFLVAFLVGSAFQPFISQAGTIHTTQPPHVSSEQVQLPAENLSSVAKPEIVIGKRRKRFDYEDMHEWEDDDDDLSYDFLNKEESSEPNLFMKIAKHWRVTAPRLVCLAALLTLITLAYCFCFRLCCRLWCRSMQETSACCFNPGIKWLFQHCYTDPMYERVRELGELMGIHISYTTYEKIKENYAPDTGFDMSSARPLLL